MVQSLCSENAFNPIDRVDSPNIYDLRAGILRSMYTLRRTEELFHILDHQRIENAINKTPLRGLLPRLSSVHIINVTKCVAGRSSYERSLHSAALLRNEIAQPRELRAENKWSEEKLMVLKAKIKIKKANYVV